MKMIRARVNIHLLRLDRFIKANPFSVITVKVQNGVPVDIKKTGEILRKQNR